MQKKNKLLLLTVLIYFLFAHTVCASENSVANSIGMEFILIPAGTFMMGQNDNDAAENEKPAHKVSVSEPFYLSKHEVTQEQWQAVMGSNPFTMPRTSSAWENLLKKPDRFISDKKPATVSWNDVQEFIQRLNQREGHNRYRLPTEAEWEYAARAGTTGAYSFGDETRQLSRFAWYGEDFTTGSIHQIGQKEPNPWGLYDIHGNVWEWVTDWYDHDYYKRSPSVNPKGPERGTEKVVRGGSWHQTGNGWRSAFRRSYPPEYRGISIGFRLALSVEE